MKRIVLLTFLFATSFKLSYSQSKDFTFCFGNISLTIFDGGKAQMTMYNSSKVAVSKKSGEFTLYGVGSPTELLKIQFNSSSIEYSYDLIRNGQGTPSVIIDNQGRRYTLCKISKSDELAGFNSEEARKEMLATSKNNDEWKSDYDKRNANKKFAPLNSFLGRWITDNTTANPYTKNNDPYFIIDIESIPFQPMQNAKMNFNPNEKKSLLKMTIVEGNESFEGISLERNTQISSDRKQSNTYEVIFVNNSQDKMFSLKFTHDPTTVRGNPEFHKFSKKSGNWERVRFSGQGEWGNILVKRVENYVPQKKLEIPKATSSQNQATTNQIKNVNTNHYSDIKFAPMKSVLGTWLSADKKVNVAIKHLSLGQPVFGMSSSDLFFKISDGTQYKLSEDIYEKSLNFKIKDGELVSYDGERRLVEINVTSPEINFKGLVMERETSLSDDPNRPQSYMFYFYNVSKDKKFVFTTNSLTNPTKSDINWFTRDPNNWWTPQQLAGESSMPLIKQVIKK